MQTSGPRSGCRIKGQNRAPLKGSIRVTTKDL